MSRSRDLLLVVAAKALVGALVLATGFRGISDDDFARVVHAQQWAAAPRVDATGTSWLPLPFWVYGLVMRALGTALGVARYTAFAHGLAAAALCYVAARWLLPACTTSPGVRRHTPVVAAVLAGLFPYSARLGVATVPELPTAALALLGVASLATRSSWRRLAGGLALWAACLSRYEAWPVAAAFAGFTALDAWRGHLRGQDARLRGALAIVIASVGPLAWLAHNAAAHGEALHFAARVRDYRQAAGPQPGGVLTYAQALVRKEPELFVAFAGSHLLLRGGDMRGVGRLTAVGATLFAALTLGAVRGGAPTHHEGRALLLLWLLMAIATADRLWGSWQRPHRERWSALSIATVGVATAAVVLRPWFARLDDFADREAEVAAGRLVATHVPPSASVLLHVADYGYFAIQAGSGRPDDLIVDRSVDPRHPGEASSFGSVAALHRRLATTGAAYVLARPTPVTAALGTPLGHAGGYTLWHAPGHPPASVRR